MKRILAIVLAAAFVAPTASSATEMCNVYHDAIMQCAKRGCDTTIDDFARCLVEEEGISERAEDGTNEVKELVHCFRTEYVCK